MVNVVFPSFSFIRFRGWGRDEEDGVDAGPIQVGAGVRLGLERVDDRRAKVKVEAKPGSFSIQRGSGRNLKTDDSAARSVQAAHVHL